MKRIRVEDWFIIPVSERPSASFYNEKVVSVTTENALDYKITTPTMEYDRDFFTVLDVDPTDLSNLPEIENEALAMELTRIIRVESEECMYKGEWAPSAVMYTGASVIYAAQTNDGPKTFVSKL